MTINVNHFQSVTKKPVKMLIKIKVEADIRGNRRRKEGIYLFSDDAVDALLSSQWQCTFLHDFMCISLFSKRNIKERSYNWCSSGIDISAGQIGTAPQVQADSISVHSQAATFISVPKIIQGQHPTNSQRPKSIPWKTPCMNFTSHVLVLTSRSNKFHF